MALLVGLLFAALHEYPDSFADEALYVEPAITLADSGTPRLPAVAGQLADGGVPGLGERSWMLPDASLRPRAVGIALFGSHLGGLRLTDYAVKVVARAALAFGILRWRLGGMGCWAVAAFAGHATVAWAQPGRADLIALAFGLLGIAVLGVGNRTGVHWAWAGAGVGCAFVMRSFGGIFWEPSFSRC